MGVTLKYMHSGHAPFQIDANMGFTSAVYEMLIYSDTERIRLLPAIPDDWTRGSVERIHARGGLVLSYAWDENEINIEITATRDAEFELCAVGYTILGDFKSGKSEGFVSLDMSEGDKITIRGNK